MQLLRSSLVNNRTQAVVCDDLGMANYAVYNNPKAELKTKDRADLLEALIGALYVDQVCSKLKNQNNLLFCYIFCWHKILVTFLFQGAGVLWGILPCDPFPAFARFYNESRLERSEIEIAAVLSNIADHGWRRTRYSSLQVSTYTQIVLLIVI